MTEVLVTGADGFIGRHLSSKLRGLGLSVHELTRKDGDIADEKTWKQLPVLDYVFHLASRSYVPDSWEETNGFMETNVMGTQRALEYCQKSGAAMTYVSAYLYGRPVRLPIREDDRLQPNNPYALSKFFAEELCKFYAGFHHVKVSIARPFNVFGSHQRREFLIPEIIEQVRCNDEIRLKDINPKRDYIYINDVVDGLIKTMETQENISVFNLGSGCSLSVAEIVEVIQRIANTNLPVISDSMVRPQEIADVRADISRAREELDWSPSYSFAEGIADMMGKE